MVSQTQYTTTRDEQGRQRRRRDENRDSGSSNSSRRSGGRAAADDEQRSSTSNRNNNGLRGSDRRCRRQDRSTRAISTTREGDHLTVEDIGWGSVSNFATEDITSAPAARGRPQRGSDPSRSSPKKGRSLRRVVTIDGGAPPTRRLRPREGSQRYGGGQRTAATATSSSLRNVVVDDSSCNRECPKPSLQRGRSRRENVNEKYSKDQPLQKKEEKSNAISSSTTQIYESLRDRSIRSLSPKKMNHCVKKHVSKTLHGFVLPCIHNMTTTMPSLTSSTTKKENVNVKLAEPTFQRKVSYGAHADLASVEFELEPTATWASSA